MEDIYLKNLKEMYQDNGTDQVFIYFMKTILNLEKSGIKNLPLENTFKEPVKRFLDIAIYLIIDGQTSEISNLILSSEYSMTLKNNNTDLETTLQLRLIKDLSYHIHYDDNYYSYILSLSNLWGNAVSLYAARTFYPNMPMQFKEQFGINGLLKYMKPEMYDLSNF